MRGFTFGAFGWIKRGGHVFFGCFVPWIGQWMFLSLD